jgi:hypothetical protein
VKSLNPEILGKHIIKLLGPSTNSTLWKILEPLVAKPLYDEETIQKEKLKAAAA